MSILSFILCLMGNGKILVLSIIKLLVEMGGYWKRFGMIFIGLKKRLLNMF